MYIIKMYELKCLQQMYNVYVECVCHYPVTAIDSIVRTTINE